MPNHQEQFVVNAPKEAVDDAIEEHFNHVLWNVLSRESGRVLVEEKLLSGKEPYNPVTFIGPTRIEILLRPLDASIEVICKGSNEYYGDDPPLQGKRDLRNGQYRAQIFLTSKISACRLALERKGKSWSAKQRYRAVKEQQDTPQPQTSTITPNVMTVGVDRATGGLKPEQLSIENFVAQLERLAALQKSGGLTDAEFEQAKIRLLKATE